MAEGHSQVGSRGAPHSSMARGPESSERTFSTREHYWEFWLEVDRDLENLTIQSRELEAQIDETLLAWQEANEKAEEHADTADGDNYARKANTLAKKYTDLTNKYSKITEKISQLKNIERPPPPPSVLEQEEVDHELEDLIDEL